MLPIAAIQRLYRFMSIKPNSLKKLRIAQILLLIAAAGFAQIAPPKQSTTKPLPQDSGTTGLKQMLVRLNTTARFMQTVAHPDDEDGGLLTLEARGKGASVVLLTLNRGEGGQNKLGSNLFDVLGIVRTLEVTAADRYYGIEERFTRVADFGFSKTPDETFQKWQGHDIPLGDMVRVIRTFRPDVLVARFSGTDRDGHGHHQASAILTKEAFRAAADPNRFPEQIKEGLQPWQPKKLYIGNVCGFGATSCPDADYTVKVNTGGVDPLLGMSYVQYAMDGLRHQLSQGAGAWTIDPGDRWAFYKLVDSTVPSTTDNSGHEKSFYDGVDTSLQGLASRLGAEQGKAPFLAADLADLQKNVDAAKATVNSNPSAAAAPLLDGLQTTRSLIAQIDKSDLSPAGKAELLTELHTKESQFETAANLAAGVELQVTADVPAGKDPDHAFMAVPGQSFDLTVRFSTKTHVDLKDVALDLPSGWKAGQTGRLVHAEYSLASFKITVPKNAAYTRPYWHRDNPESDALNTIDNPQYVTLPFPPPPVRAHAAYTLDGKPGMVKATAMVPFTNSAGEAAERALAVAPAYSVMLEPGEQVIPVSGGAASTVKVGVYTNLPGVTSGTLHIEVPAGWRAEPASVPVEFHSQYETKESEFRLIPASLKEGRAEVRAVFDSGGQTYGEGYSVVTREDLDTFYYYQPSLLRVSIVDVNVPKNLKIGYIMGAGDEIPTVLKQIGVDLTMIDAEKLASTNLAPYATIVVGIRAYDTQKGLVANNQKLLDWVSAGGTLIVQYNSGVGDFNKGRFTPYSAQLSRARVTVEDSPVQILAPDDSVFNVPNKITEKDFDGWVQERGLYFMDHWDDHFKPLLACNDPGEAPQKGGLLRAQYGKGTYIYTGYAFFRQLPAGVPGPIRLFVNLLDAGH
ncbi:MAG TPA: PIG-L family deacetylase [Terriglobales bacterium]